MLVARIRQVGLTQVSVFAFQRNGSVNPSPSRRKALRSATTRGAAAHFPAPARMGFNRRSHSAGKANGAKLS